MTKGYSEADLQQMFDHYSIEQLMKRYARALDEKNYDLLDSCFSADAHIDYSAAGGIAGAYPQVKAWLAEVLDPIPEMQHFITNVEVVGCGDTASATTYTLNVNGLRGGDGGIQHMVVGAVYIDRLARLDCGWRIVEREERRLCTMGTVFGPEQQ
jgi:3-phenylpropionate/cinnamic acid dioxygenase small subunit